MLRARPFYRVQRQGFANPLTAPRGHDVHVADIQLLAANDCGPMIGRHISRGDSNDMPVLLGCPDCPPRLAGMSFKKSDVAFAPPWNLKIQILSLDLSNHCVPEIRDHGQLGDGKFTNEVRHKRSLEFAYRIEFHAPCKNHYRDWWRGLLHDEA